ncbi:MAG TPA: hypothetical protein VFH55_12160 [Nitrospiria bacterium]|nr:hypothetical protein [Nitrospiria bacterium]
MKSTFLWLVGWLSLAAFTTAGCAANHIDLKPEAAEKIKTVKLISIIPQAALVPTVQPSAGAMTAGNAGAMFGAIGAAIGATIAAGIERNHYKEAELKLAALVEPQKRIEIRQEFLDKLRQAAEGSNRFVVQEAETVIEGDGTKERNRALKEMSQDAVLTVLTHYYLSPDFKVFTVTSQAELWQKGSEKRVYLGQWQYHSVPRDGDGDDPVIATWAADNGEALVTVAHEAIDKIALMMRIDLLGEAANPGDLGTTSLNYTRQADGAYMNVEGKILVREGGWDVVRDNEGTLHAAYVP